MTGHINISTIGIVIALMIWASPALHPGFEYFKELALLWLGAVGATNIYRGERPA